jgi:hypothetical protein
MKNKNFENGNEIDSGLSIVTQPGFFEIYVKGHLDDSWSDWLEGMKFTLIDNGETMLSGYIQDQASLMGVLNKLYSLNLTLLSVRKVNRVK